MANKVPDQMPELIKLRSLGFSAGKNMRIKKRRSAIVEPNCPRVVFNFCGYDEVEINR